MNPVIVQMNHPIKAFQLVGSHGTVRRKERGLMIETDNAPALAGGGLEHLRILFGFRHATPRGGGTFLLAALGSGCGRHGTCVQ
jgi:hypothetical protein